MTDRNQSYKRDYYSDFYESDDSCLLSHITESKIPNRVKMLILESNYTQM